MSRRPFSSSSGVTMAEALIALFLTLITERFLVSPEFRLFVAVGFLGGFTTFSSFSFETFTLLRGSGWWAASLNFFGNTVLGMIGVILGVVVAQLIQRPIYGG